MENKPPATDDGSILFRNVNMSLELLSDTKVHGGQLQRYQHASVSCNSPMVFAIFLPSTTATANAPVLYWLSGLTCTDENFSQKAGAFDLAQALGLVIVMPDTSPRNLGIEGEDDDYDLGSGAGFYVNATQLPWSAHYHMYDYVNVELPALVAAHFPVTSARSICGHSMGGHGALISALRQPGVYKSVSAMAPIASPSQSPWGQKIFTAYLGTDQADWAAWDANALVHANQIAGIKPQALFVCQGSADPFYQEQLQPQLFVTACEQSNQPLIYQERQGYDHSYYYISSFIAEHLRYHAQHMGLG
jgi:S-formylglutathione hydrolase